MAGTGSFREDDEVGNVFGQEELYKRGGRLSAEDFSQRGAGGGGETFWGELAVESVWEQLEKSSIHSWKLPHPSQCNKPAGSVPQAFQEKLCDLVDGGRYPCSPSFKEDTYFVSRLKSSEKALQEFKDKLVASHGSDSM
ncbi:hypothetical protein CK203_105906 [Vitis vinifera]|uniref:Uncharacterized protein n=1 Tax=Vitis vinifera TaxID=29760 RepID=A0A438E6I0_VITVI|nr:hypothetical protein CK203_105906 [Vitis vinifera]